MPPGREATLLSREEGRRERGRREERERDKKREVVNRSIET